MVLQQRVKLFLGIISMSSIKKRKPIRMCLACRERSSRDILIRLEQDSSEIVSYRGTGRSFYICYNCINNEKKVKGLAKRFGQDRERFVKFLKELVKNGQS